METPVSFISGGLEIEGLFEKLSGTRGAVITHPHPLYGGEMRNFVVAAVRRCYIKFGYSTLRFNFRGVGKSKGKYDDGIGEQQDVRGAAAYLRDSGIDTLHFCGYSFGAWVNAKAAMGELFLDAMIMVAPPIVFMDFKGIEDIPTLRCVVAGDRDEIAPLDQIRKMLPLWNSKARLEAIPGADHFFSGRTEALEAVISRQLESLT